MPTFDYTVYGYFAFLCFSLKRRLCIAQALPPWEDVDQKYLPLSIFIFSHWGVELLTAITKLDGSDYNFWPFAFDRFPFLCSTYLPLRPVGFFRTTQSLPSKIYCPFISHCLYYPIFPLQCSGYSPSLNVDRNGSSFGKT